RPAKNRGSPQGPRLSVPARRLLFELGDSAFERDAGDDAAGMALILDRAREGRPLVEADDLDHGVAALLLGAVRSSMSADSMAQRHASSSGLPTELVFLLVTNSPRVWPTAGVFVSPKYKRTSLPSLSLKSARCR